MRPTSPASTGTQSNSWACTCDTSALSRSPAGVPRSGSASTSAEISLRVARYSASVRILWMVIALKP